MTCEKCDGVLGMLQILDEGYYYPYRWKHATVAIVACNEHAEEIMDYLNKRLEE